MKRAGWKLLVALVVVVLGVVWWKRPRSPEPTFGGKPLGEWLEQYTNLKPNPARAGDFSALRDDARDAVRHIGTNAIPYLLDMLSEKDSIVKTKLLAPLRRQSWIRARWKEAFVQNQKGLAGFMILGAEGREAVPALLDILEQHPSEISESGVVQALAAIGPAASAGIPAILHRAADTNKSVSIRGLSVGALQRIQAPSESVLPGLLRCLDDPHPSVRWSAASLLGNYRSEARQAIPALLRLLEDGDGSVRNAAKRALEQIDPGAAARRRPESASQERSRPESRTE